MFLYCFSDPFSIYISSHYQDSVDAEQMDHRCLHCGTALPGLPSQDCRLQQRHLLGFLVCGYTQHCGSIC